MKLRALELDQFKRFDHPVRLEGFDDGLNLLCGPNEMGKSTIMAALHAVLFERHRARAASTSRGCNLRDTEPRPGSRSISSSTVSLYRIEKRFLRNENAHLRLPDGRCFEGPEAEEESCSGCSVSPGLETAASRRSSSAPGA